MPSKVNFHYTSQFKHVTPETDTNTFREAYFTSKPEIITDSSNVSNIFDIMIEKLLERISNFQKDESGWIFEYVLRFEIKYALYEPHIGRSYIPLPREIAFKKAVINVKNLNDHEWFKWSVTVAFYIAKKDPQRLIKEC